MEPVQLKPAAPKTKFHFTAVPIEKYDARALYAMKFQDTARIIAKMDTMQKSSIAAEVQSNLDSLYNQANRFGNPDYALDEQPSAAQFRGIMGKIKHWETILYWLFEIDIMMGEDKLSKLVQQAEKDLAQYAKKLSKEEVEKKRQIIFNPPVAHTQEILDMASSIAGKYFGKLN